VSAFRFRLLSIQRLRERERDQAAQALQQAQLAKQKLLDQISQLESENQQQVAARSQASTGVVDVQRVIDTQRYQLTLLERVRFIQGNVKLIDEEIEKRRAKLVVCEQGVRALEKLEEHGRENWINEQSARSQSRLDEWASYQHFQRHYQSPHRNHPAVDNHE
jgi:flagellar export protein FliJ